MRILFVTPYLPLSNKPRPFNFILRLAREHDVDVVAQAEPQEIAAAASSSDLAKLREACGSVAVVPRWRARAIANCAFALPTHEPLRVAYCRSEAFEAHVRARVESGSYDVLHIDRERLAPLGEGVKVTGVRRLLDYTDAISAFNKLAAAVDPRPAWRIALRVDAQRMARFEAEVRPFFDAALVTSSSDRAQLGGGGVPNVTVLPNGVDADWFTPDGTGRAGQLVFVGVMNYVPNIDAVRFLVRSLLPEIRASLPDAQLTLVGPNPTHDVERLSSSNVRLTGAVPDVRPYLRDAQLVLMPIRVAVGFPNKLAEAMAMGKAILATPEIASRLDVVPGVHLEVANRGAFAATALRLLQDEDRRRELGAAAREFAEQNLAWQPIVGRLVGCYRSNETCI